MSRPRSERQHQGLYDCQPILMAHAGLLGVVFTTFLVSYSAADQFAPATWAAYLITPSGCELRAVHRKTQHPAQWGCGLMAF